jgi:hypothetical protein
MRPGRRDNRPRWPVVDHAGSANHYKEVPGRSRNITKKVRIRASLAATVTSSTTWGLPLRWTVWYAADHGDSEMVRAMTIREFSRFYWDIPAAPPSL